MKVNPLVRRCRALSQTLTSVPPVEMSPAQNFIARWQNSGGAERANYALFRTRGRVTPPEPIIKAFHNVQCRDAVLAWERTEDVLDEKEGSPTRGQPVTRWDGRTVKKHPVTGEDVPDETARIPLLSYVNLRPADWPDTDFIVGNPPFIGPARMRDALGDGYTEAVRATYPDVPESADFVMYWWHKAALLVRAGKVARFGLIATNSLRQTFNRRVVEGHLKVVSDFSPAKPPASRTNPRTRQRRVSRKAVRVFTKGRRAD